MKNTKNNKYSGNIVLRNQRNYWIQFQIRYVLTSTTINTNVENTITIFIGIFLLVGMFNCSKFDAIGK